MAECSHKYGVDVFMDDRGYYRAECADCDWKSGQKHTEAEAVEAAREHDPSHAERAPDS